MNESMLLRLALITSIMGFVGLCLLVLLQKPVLQEPTQDLLTAMDVEIIDVYTAATGSVVIYSQEHSGFIDSEVSEELIGRKARITGRLEGDFFSINTIEV